MDHQAALHITSSPKLNAESPLAELAAAIRRLNSLILEHQRSALRASLDLGSALAWARARVAVRQWMTWRREHCPEISKRRDEVYRQLAAARPIIERELAKNPDLSIREALKLITVPKARPPKPKPEALEKWKGLSADEKRAGLAADGIDGLLQNLPAGWRDELANRVVRVKHKTGDEVLGERIRDQVEKIRSLLVHFEQHKDEIQKGLTAIKRATRGVGKAPATAPAKIDPIVNKTIRAMRNGNDVPTEQSAAAAMAVHAARETAGTISPSI